ncbi:SRPBCC domain-containing protein [Leptospira yasudae]|uniref:SRPBCC domain-containing protein n=1 Tax=Leptospira yasudae TaxID=2202201 RepID=UPI001C4FE315|nr:SRPBCC domain-containing protein [Leptospira yasudae]MBW0435646.1 SRPBCC domain-containing protein [Leptospira yasudae]
MSAFDSVLVETPDRELVLTRIFDAPRKLVYKVWTQPKHVAQWWGPKDFTNPVCEIDLRVGGEYRLTMRSPDGNDYPVKGVFLEVIENEKIVRTDLMDEHPIEWMETLNKELGNEQASPNYVETVTFEDYENKTKVTIHSRFQSNAVRDAFRNMGMVEGWTESLVRFEAELSKAVKTIL